jgi:hypothetical protein
MSVKVLKQSPSVLPHIFEHLDQFLYIQGKQGQTIDDLFGRHVPKSMSAYLENAVLNTSLLFSSEKHRSVRDCCHRNASDASFLTL